MAKQTINIGSGELAGDGESLRSAFDKINDNFDEVYTGSTTTLGSDTTPALGGNLDLSGNDITGIGNLNITGNITATGSISASLAYSNLTSTPTTLAGYGITDAYTQTQVDTAITNATSSIVIQSGSTQSIDVVAQDSTVLVDSVNGTLNATTLTGALPAINGSALTNVTTTFANITSTPTTLAGYGITDSLQLGTSATTALAGNTALFSGAFADLTSKPTTIAGYGITDATSTASPAFTGAVDFTGATSVDFTGATISGTSFLTSYTETDPVVGAITGIVKADGSGNISAAVAGTDYLTTVAFADVTGKPTTLAGYGITDALTSGGNITLGGDLDVGGNSIVSASNGPINIAPNGTGDIVMSGQVKFDEGSAEKFTTTNGATGVTALDCSTGHVHYLTAPAGDITANFTNLDLTAEYGTNVTIVIDQGNTQYEVTAVQIGGVAQTIVWQGNSAPTGTANGVDSFSFTILNDGGTYVVLGQMVAFGGV